MLHCHCGVYFQINCFKAGNNKAVKETSVEPNTYMKNNVLLLSNGVENIHWIYNKVVVQTRSLKKVSLKFRKIHSVSLWFLWNVYEHLFFKTPPGNYFCMQSIQLYDFKQKEWQANCSINIYCTNFQDKQVEEKETKKKCLGEILA